MTDVQQITTTSGLVFDALVAGPADGPLVVLLHGFPQSRHAWTHQVAALADAGLRAVAPDQRGYSPGARPDPADASHYLLDRLVDDVLDIAQACGHGNRRFHLVGMDWGGQVAWTVAARHAGRLASLNVLSRPHPNAFAAAMKDDPAQAQRSAHHKRFFDPATTTLLLENDARRLRDMLAGSQVPQSGIDNYLSVVGDPAAMEAAVTWYRASGLRIDLPSIAVPTLYVWGNVDSSVGRLAAQGTAAWVSAPYRFVELQDIGHFASDQAPARVSELLLTHIGQYPA